MVAFANVIAQVGTTMLGSILGKDDPQQTAAAQMRQDDRLTDMLIAESTRSRQKIAEPGKTEEPQWLRAVAQAWAGYEAAAKRRNPDAEDAYKELLARSERQMEARIEDKQFGMEA